MTLLGVPWPGIFGALRITHVQGGRTLLSFPFLFRHPFRLAYTHSIYVTPVAEKFQVTPSIIRLEEISTRSWGVVEYYGTPGIVREREGEIRIQELKFQVSHLSMMIGFVGRQRFVWENQTYALYNLAEPGAVLAFEPKGISPAGYLWEKVFPLSPPK